MSILRQNELSTNDRTAMIRQAFWLEYATLAWMTVEAAVAIASGIAANSLTLVAFGIDSVIELASAGVLIWRLTVELRYGQMFAENAERRASRIGGSLLFILAVYVVASAGWKLWTHQGAEFSLPGLILCVLAIPIMYFLPAVSLTSPKRLAVARSRLMQSRASPAAGSPLSWSQLSSCSLLQVRGGWTRWPPSVSFGFLFAKVERLGAEMSVVLITTDPHVQRISDVR